MKTPRGRNGLLLFVLFTVIGLLFFTTYFLDDLARMPGGPICSNNPLVTRTCRSSHCSSAPDLPRCMP